MLAGAGADLVMAGVAIMVGVMLVMVMVMAGVTDMVMVTDMDTAGVIQDMVITLLIIQVITQVITKEPLTGNDMPIIQAE